MPVLPPVPVVRGATMVLLLRVHLCLGLTRKGKDSFVEDPRAAGGEGSVISGSVGVEGEHEGGKLGQGQDRKPERITSEEMRKPNKRRKAETEGDEEERQELHRTSKRRQFQPIFAELRPSLEAKGPQHDPTMSSFGGTSESTVSSFGGTSKSTVSSSGGNSKSTVSSLGGTSKSPGDLQRISRTVHETNIDHSASVDSAFEHVRRKTTSMTSPIASAPWVPYGSQDAECIDSTTLLEHVAVLLAATTEMEQHTILTNLVQRSAVLRRQRRLSHATKPLLPGDHVNSHRLSNSLDAVKSARDTAGEDLKPALSTSLITSAGKQRGTHGEHAEHGLSTSGLQVGPPSGASDVPSSQESTVAAFVSSHSARLMRAWGTNKSPPFSIWPKKPAPSR